MKEHWKAQVLIKDRSLLGEGPFFQEESDTFGWVDITAGTLYLLDAQGRVEKIQTGQYLGAAVPTAGGRFIGAMATGIYLFDRQSIQPVARPGEMRYYQRFNDGKCDAAGRFWCGTMPLFDAAGGEEGALYRLDCDGSTRRMAGCHVSNGLAWSGDGSTLYYADTPLHRVDAFDYDLRRGELSGRRTVAELGSENPDGMTIDEQGMLWVALWGSGRVARIDPATGRETGEIAVPARYVTSCCFGGKDYRTLYITSCAEQEPENPLAGCVFTAHPGVVGTRTRYFDDSRISTR